VWQRGAEVAAIPAPVVPVVDTTGAGDTFIGALADALSRDESPVAAAHWAVHAASRSVGALGATTAMPDRDDVLAAIAALDDSAPPGPRSAPRSEEAAGERR
jgi:ribokinase